MSERKVYQKAPPPKEATKEEEKPKTKYVPKHILEVSKCEGNEWQ